jgi:protease IV
MSRPLSAFVAVLALLTFLAPALAQTRIGMLEIEGKVSGRPGEFSWLSSTGKPTLRDLVQLIEASPARQDIDALVIRLKDAELDRTQIEELGEAMLKARKAGRKIHLFAEHYTPAEILLGSYADKAIIQAGGAVAFPGLYMEEMYLAETLAWVGVKADFVQVGDYKGASETMSNAAPSPQWEENISQLLDSMYQIMREDVKRGRSMNDEQLDAAMKAVWLGTAEQGVKVGLIDAQVDLPTLGKHISGRDDARFVKIEPEGKAEATVDTSNPFAAISAMMEMFTKKPRHKPTRPTIAVLHIDGPIIDGDSTAGGLFGSASVGSRTIRNALEDIRAEDQIKGVIIRVDSPGGSATASEVMWQGIRRVADKKPVWVSIGSMAASGGYYVAVAGDRIYVNPSSIVGSIGVVGGKMALGGLYDKVGINVVGRGRGPMADMFASARPWTPEQRTLVRAKMSDIYDLFTQRVVQGRNGINLSATAEGRLFTGARALDLKMADRIGGLDTAIGDLAAHVKLAGFDVMHYPGPKGLDELLEDLFSGFGASSARSPRGSALAGELLGALGQAMGPRNWQTVAAQLEALAQLRREPAVLVSPRAILFR